MKIFNIIVLFVCICIINCKNNFYDFDDSLNMLSMINSQLRDKLIESNMIIKQLKHNNEIMNNLLTTRKMPINFSFKGNMYKATQIPSTRIATTVTTTSRKLNQESGIFKMNKRYYSDISKRSSRKRILRDLLPKNLNNEKFVNDVNDDNDNILQLIDAEMNNVRKIRASDDNEKNLDNNIDDDYVLNKENSDLIDDKENIEGVQTLNNNNNHDKKKVQEKSNLSDDTEYIENEDDTKNIDYKEKDSVLNDENEGEAVEDNEENKKMLESVLSDNKNVNNESDIEEDDTK